MYCVQGFLQNTHAWHHVAMHFSNKIQEDRKVVHSLEDSSVLNMVNLQYMIH